MPDYANGTRSFVEGLTFNNAAELEAALRAAAAQRNLSLDDFLKLYRSNKQGIDESYNRWAEANPGLSMAGEFAGALAPGIIGAFVPGGQGATAAAAGRGAGILPRVARAMAEPFTMAAERYAPGLMAKRGAPLALALADELGTGVVQSVGNADTLADAPSMIMRDLPENLAFSLAVRGAERPARWAGRKGKQAVQSGLSVVRGKPRVEAPASLRVPQQAPAYSGPLRRIFGF